MPSDEGHIHWTGAADENVNFLGQELQLTSEVSNAVTVKADPIGTIRIRARESALTGLPLPTEGWEVVPGTDPVIEARMDGHYPIGYIRLRLA
jgi:hypothetical protein